MKKMIALFTLIMSVFLSNSAFAVGLKGTFQLSMIQDNDTNDPVIINTLEFKKDGTMLSIAPQDDKSNLPPMVMYGNYYVEKRTGHILIEIDCFQGMKNQYMKIYVNANEFNSLEVDMEKQIYIFSTQDNLQKSYILTRLK